MLWWLCRVIAEEVFRHVRDNLGTVLDIHKNWPLTRKNLIQILSWACYRSVWLINLVFITYYILLMLVTLIFLTKKHEAVYFVSSGVLGMSLCSTSSQWFGIWNKPCLHGNRTLVCSERRIRCDHAQKKKEKKRKKSALQSLLSAFSPQPDRLEEQVWNKRLWLDNVSSEHEHNWKLDLVA